MPVPFVALVLIEACLYFSAVYAGAYIRFLGDWAFITENIGDLWPRALPFTAFMLLGTSALGAYDRALRDYDIAMVLRLSVGILLGLCGLALFFYVFPDIYFGRGIMALSALVALVFMVFSRQIFQRIVDEDLFKRRILVLGAGEKAALIDQKLRRKSDRRAFRIVGYMPLPNEKTQVASEKLIDPQPLAPFVAEREIQDIVVAADDRRGGLDMNDLLQCRLSGVQIIELVSFFERESGKILLSLLSPGWLVFSRGFRRSMLRRVFKRAFDLTASGILLLLTLPIMAFTALLILIETGRPIFYRQIRVGEGGREFELIKFRSMKTDAESDGKAQWASENDDRITRVGSFLRNSRIDELPQILNVFRGDMSFVGPRPERPQFVDELAEVIPYYRERHTVNPGITGWAQLCYPYGSSVKDAEEKLKFDLYYVKNHTLFFDLNIMFRTVEVILFGKGAR